MASEQRKKKRPNGLAEIIRSKKPPGFLGGNFKPHYNIGLDAFVTSRSEKNRIAKEKGLEECGDRVHGDRTTAGAIPESARAQVEDFPDLRTEKQADFQEKEKSRKERIMSEM